MHFVFGGFLIYTGINTAIADEEDEDPSQHPLVQWLQRWVPFVPYYDEAGRFFVRVPVDANGDAIVAKDGAATETGRLTSSEVREGYGGIDFSSAAPAAAAGEKGETRLRATMLFLVVCCLEISDVLFAVDSVSAIVAQVNDLFLAYTSAVFAMLGLRAMFFVIDVLAQMFSLLKYGVSAVLVFIGLKLVVSRMYHIPPSVVCMVLVTSVGGSMLASVVQDRWAKAAEARALSKASYTGRSPAPTPTIKDRAPKADP